MAERKKELIKKKTSSSLDNIQSDELLKPRSASLNNIEELGTGTSPHASPKPDRHHLHLLSASPLKGLKKKLLKLSKSNTDITSSAQNNQESCDKKSQHDANLLLPHSSNNNGIETRSPREARKAWAKDEMRKKKSTAESNNVYNEISSATGGLKNSTHSTAMDRMNSVTSDTLSVTTTRERQRLSQDSTDQYIVVESQPYDDSQDSPSETDETDGFPAEEYTQQEMERLLKKIEKTKDELVQMQQTKDEYLKDFLKSADNNTENSAALKTKINFEKNNQKTNITIQTLQKRLEKYLMKKKELEENGIHGPKRIIRAVQDSVRSGASSLTGAVSKPLGSLNSFMKEKKASDKKNASTDNVSIHITQNDDDIERTVNINNNASDEDTSSCSAQVMGSGNQSDVECIYGNADQHMTALQREQIHLQNAQIEILKKENDELRDNYAKLKDDVDQLIHSVQEERYKNDQLNNELNDMYHQWNDLTELHQNEMSSLKQEMVQTLERIECMEYRFAERSGDIEEAVGSCETRITKMELQYHQQQQLLLSVDGYFDAGGNTKLLVSKLLSLVLNIFTIVLVVISTLSKIVMPFASTRTRMVTSTITIVCIILFVKHSDNSTLVTIFDLLRQFFQPIYHWLPNRTYDSVRESTEPR